MREIDDWYAARDRLEDATRRVQLCGKSGDYNGKFLAEIDAEIARADVESAATAAGAMFVQLLRFGVELAPKLVGDWLAPATLQVERDEEVRELRAVCNWLRNRVLWLTDANKELTLEVARWKAESERGGDVARGGFVPRER